MAKKETNENKKKNARPYGRASIATYDLPDSMFLRVVGDRLNFFA